MDKIAGVIYGQAIGDAVGAPYEFLSQKQVAQKFPNAYAPLTYPLHDPERIPGEWTDDTDQAICILDAYYASRLQGQTGIDPCQLACNLHHWMETNGRGIGIMTAGILRMRSYKQDPIRCAERYYRLHGRVSAPNGALMRTAYVAVIRPWDLDWVHANAVMCCLVTHADLRCVASCVAASITIACLIQGRSIQASIAEGLQHALPYHAEVATWLYPSWSQLKLTNLREQGYTYKCLGAGFWALHELDCGNTFPQVLKEIVRAGGDADTNGAVAGALMGAAIGASNLPANLLTGLKPRSLLDHHVTMLQLG